MSIPDSQRRAAAQAALAFALVAPSCYLLLRLYERLRRGPRDMLLLLSEPYAAFYWRCLLAAWAGGFAALLAWRALAGRGDSPLSQRWPALLLALAPVAIVWALHWP